MGFTSGREAHINQRAEQEKYLRERDNPLPNPQQYFSPEMINQFFNLSAGNLGQRGAQMRGRAQADAGALAGARGLVNPSGFVLGAGSQAYSPFVNALQGLESNRAGALQGNQAALFNALFNVAQGNRQYGLQQDQLSLQRQGLEQNQAGGFDYLSSFLPLAGLTLPGGGSLLGSFLFPSLYQGLGQKP